MQTLLGLFFVLHVILLGVLVGRFRWLMRPWGLCLVSAYLGGFYLIWGQFFASHPNFVKPEEVLEDDYYRQRQKTKSYSDPSGDNSEVEKVEDDLRPYPKNSKERDLEDQVQITP